MPLRTFLFGNIDNPDIDIVKKRLAERRINYEYAGIDADNPDGITLLTPCNTYVDRGVFEFLGVGLEEKVA